MQKITLIISVKTNYKAIKIKKNINPLMHNAPKWSDTL